MKKVISCFSILIVLFVVTSCQNNAVEIPKVYDNLTVEQLQEQTSLPIQLPQHLPFEPVAIFAELDDYADLYQSGEQIEEIHVHFIKTDPKNRYLDVTISNLEQQEAKGERLELSDGTSAIYAEDDIGQLLYWKKGDVHYRLVYYTSEKINEGQEPLTHEQLLAVAHSFE